MAKTLKVISNLGITESQLRRFYIYGLVDSLHSVSGIGEKRLQKLECDLCDQYDDERIPNAYNWVYRLMLDIMNEPLRAQNLCEVRENGCCLLNQMRTVTQTDASQANAVLKDVLRPQEQNILMHLYRDHDPYETIAREFGCSCEYARRLKRQAIKKLRNNTVAVNALKRIVFMNIEGTDDADGDTTTP